MLDIGAELQVNKPATTYGVRRAFSKRWGAEIVDRDTVRFRVWAPAAESMQLLLRGRKLPLIAQEGGWFERTVEGIAPGAYYRLLLPDGTAVPDPATRAQIGGIAGPSAVVDPQGYCWSDGDWRGRPWEEAVIYELHVGTFTPEGTFAAAERRLARLAEIGFTAIELMPVSQFFGLHGWGYDGVLPYSPHHAYGPPEAMKSFIDAAHHAGLMVILDVVYNHFGPRGNYLPLYAPAFFRPENTGWGQSIDFGAQPVRDYFIENALYWLVEFNLDGLRLDAVHTMEDQHSSTHVLAELAAKVAATCRDRPRHLTLEDGHNSTRLLAEHSAAVDGRRYNAAWNDDLHHALHVIATGEGCGYFTDFAENPFEKTALALTGGFVYQKGPTDEEAEPAGPPPASLPPTSFIDFLQNHDQIGNRPLGDRMITNVDEALMRALTTVLVLAPHIPLMFQGDDYGERRPFMFFIDCDDTLAEDVRNGRFAEAGNYGGVPEGAASPADLPDPSDPSSFLRSKLDWARAETAEGQRYSNWLKKLLACRRRHIVPALAGAGAGTGRVVKSGRNILALDWQLDGVLLQLRANLGTEPLALPEASGHLIHAEPKATHLDDDGRLPGRSVLVFLADA